MITVTSVVQPPVGAVIAVHCRYCHITEFTTNPYARKPEDGDYWLFELPCELHQVEGFKKEVRAINTVKEMTSTP